MEISNKIRYYHYISGVFTNQISDPLCSVCSAMANSIKNVKADMETFEKALESHNENLPLELKSLVSKTKKILSGLNPPAVAEGQKKVGKCKMPKGICFVKISKAIIENI
jgi:hypothetical protein